MGCPEWRLFEYKNISFINYRFKLSVKIKMEWNYVYIIPFLDLNWLIIILV